MVPGRRRSHTREESADQRRSAEVAQLNVDISHGEVRVFASDSPCRYDTRGIQGRVLCKLPGENDQRETQQVAIAQPAANR